MYNNTTLPKLVSDLLSDIKSTTEFGYTDYENGEDWIRNYVGIEDDNWIIELEYSATDDNGFLCGRIDNLRVYEHTDEGDTIKVSIEIYEDIYHDIKKELEDLN